MRRTPPRRLLAAALLAASLLSPLAAAPATAQPAPAAVHQVKAHCPPGGLGHKLTARLDKAIADVRREAGIPGLTVGLWMPGKGSYVRSTGVADKVTGAPMRPDLHARIGSETKTFTVTALLQLVDDGRVRLDDPIAKYIRGVPDGRRITLRHLAEMRSGLFSYTEDDDFVQALLSDPRRPFTPRELLSYAFKHPNNAPPNTTFEYSNTNIVLLGLVIEKVTGRHLADVIHQRVLRPSGMHRTLFPHGAEFPEPHARGYTNQTLSGEVEDATDWNPSWAWAAGAMISDLQDLRRWAPSSPPASSSARRPRSSASRRSRPATPAPATAWASSTPAAGSATTAPCPATRP
ncbi:serine hydrolase domain-containing protein [Streptomyces sp. NPDC052415]|uniref:serine hydrolase domain-containing protein n=1 Tax=Streptomyces sp. NPDC052415 TaxID=3365690 RepID=UPI0037D10058